MSEVLPALGDQSDSEQLLDQLEPLHRVLKQAQAVAQHKGTPVNVGCAVIEIAQNAELKLQLGEGTFDLVADEFLSRVESFARDIDEVVPLADGRVLVVMRNLNNRDHLELAGAKLQRLMSEPITAVNHSVLVSCNAGFAYTEGLESDDGSAKFLFEAAESALKLAHREQRCVIYNPSSIANETDRWQLRVELEQALHTGEFHAYFQPVIDARYESVTAAAAKLVWHSATNGIVPLEKFSAALDEVDLARPAAWHFIKTVIGNAAHWSNSVAAIIPLPASAFTDDEVLQVIADALAIYDATPDRLIIEAPEEALTMPKGREVLKELLEQKIRVRISGVGGCGFPLDLLGEFPANEVSFATSVIGRGMPPKLRQMVFELFRRAGLSLVAINVRDAKLAAKYKELGFASIQGPAIGKLMNPSDFSKWLTRKGGGA